MIILTPKYNSYSQNSPVIEQLCAKCVENSRIDADLYAKFDVKRGLRDLNGKGVLTGLTEISEIQKRVLA